MMAALRNRRRSVISAADARGKAPPRMEARIVEKFIARDDFLPVDLDPDQMRLFDSSRSREAS